jgi:hypothetical protein
MAVKVFFVTLIFCLLVACDSSDCNLGMAADQLRLADTIEKNDKAYYLYTRTTGWNDKVVFFELYDEKPLFDKCTYESNIKELYAIHFNSFPEDPVPQYVKEIILQPDQLEKLKIIYTKDKNEGIENVYDVKFTHY